MIYDIRHLTTYEYASSVAFSHCALRLLPIAGPGQSVIDTSIEIAPRPVEMAERTCFFGNRVTSITIESPHRVLTIDTRSTVDVQRAPPPNALATPPWGAVRDEACAIDSLDSLSPAHFVHASRLVPDCSAAAEYAQRSFAASGPILAAAIDLMRRIRDDFRYDPKATLVSTPLSEVFEKRRGVCQDFAHVMIAGLRALGFPAAYISGYLRTNPPAGSPRLAGADASHAWVSLWCGKNVGWVGLDPTNAMLIGDDHIVLARGRDYADISPVSGIILSSGDQAVDVKVDVIARV